MINNNIKNIVIIGGGLAGDTATAALREAGYTGGIQLVSDELHRPYDRPPLSKAALLAPDEAAKIHFRAAEWYAENHVELILGDGAAKLDPAAHQVTLRSGRVIAYDKLLIATGTRARRLRLLETTGAPVFYLRSLDDCEALRPLLVPGAKIVLIGAGVIGMEVAATANALGCAVTVVELAPRVMARSVSPAVSGFIADCHREHGVTIHCGAKITGMHCVNGRAVLELEGGIRLEPDAVIAGIGAEPITELAQEAGLRVDDGIIIDRFTRTSDPDIHAAGDVARFESVARGQHIRAEHWRHAIDQATCAAHAMLGADTAYEERPWVWSDQYDLNIQITGEGTGETEILRGDPATKSFTAFQLREGCIVGAVSVNQAKWKRPIAELVHNQARIEPAILADPNADIKKLASGMK
jgi:3-phenylpropionate/trans-cinnamate dioxygenase ferredoxin reductase subunit